MSARTWLVLALALALTLTPLARAQSPAELEAKQHFAAAQKLFESAHWAEALVQYQRSYELSKYPALLYKIALCQDQLGQYAEALDTYGKYLELDPQTDRRGGIEERVAKLQQLLAPPPPREEEPAPPVPVPMVVEKPAAPPPPPPPHTPAYKKWWVWTIVGVGVAGAALGVGLGIGLSSRFTPNLGILMNGLVRF